MRASFIAKSGIVVVVVADNFGLDYAETENKIHAYKFKVWSHRVDLMVEINLQSGCLKKKSVLFLSLCLHCLKAKYPAK